MNVGMEQGRDEVKAMLESGRCRGNVKGVEQGVQSEMYGRWKMAA